MPAKTKPSGGDTIPPASSTRFQLELLERRRTKNGRNLLIIIVLIQWRRGESESSGLLKIRNLLKNRNAQNALASEIAPNWNVSGTRVFRCNTRIFDSFL